MSRRFPGRGHVRPVVALGGGTPAADQTRYLFFATRTRVPSGALVTAAAGANHVLARLCFGLPEYPVNALRLHFSGFACLENGSAPQETVLPGNASVIDKVIAEVDGVRVQAAFGGQAGATIASGALGAWTDDIVFPAGLPAGGTLTLWVFYHTAAGEKQLPVFVPYPANGEKAWAAGDLATLEGHYAAPAGTSAAAAPARLWGPDFLVAKGWDGRPVALVVADSIGYERNDIPPDARGNLGWVRRWLDADDPVHGRIPHMIIGVPGAKAEFELGANATKRWDIIDQVTAWNGGKPPYTVELWQIGRNDNNPFAGDTQRSRIIGALDRAEARNPAMRRVGCTLTPYTASNPASGGDNFLSEGAQTFVAGAEFPGGNQYRYQADLLATGLDGRLDAAIDLQGLWPGGKWPAASFVTTLAAQAGTSGSAAYNQISVTAPPEVGGFLRWGASGALFGNVIAVSGSGPYLVTLDRNNTAVAAAGGAVFAPATNDGVHPLFAEVRRIWQSLGPAQKAKLR